MLNYFDKTGRCIPTKGMRVFGENPSYYYKIKQPELDFKAIFDRSKKFNLIHSEIEAAELEHEAIKKLNLIKENEGYQNLLGGAYLPFIYECQSEYSDLGEELEESLLPNLKDSFMDSFPNNHFKAVLQSDTKLPKNISIDPNSNYQSLIEASKKGPVIGWYFPQAFQEFDVASQRAQIKELPDIPGLQKCLSGGIDISSALVGLPGLLIDNEDYSPILCLSAYVHNDPRMVLLLKAYGPHMEFWCMTQMLTKDKTQVSEQWAGGMTVF